MKVLSEKEREERKEAIIKAVEDAIDLGNHYIIVASFMGENIAACIGEFCTIDEKTAILSKENVRALADVMRGSKGIIIGFRR